MKRYLSQSLISGLALVLLLNALALPRTGQAQDVQRVAVLVNDEPISMYDINQRLGFAVATTGGVQSEDQLDRLRARVVRQLVDEKLQWQEASELEVPVNELEVEEYFASWANAFNQTPQQFSDFLAQVGTSKDSLTDQIRSQIAWERLVGGRFRNQAAVGDEEVDDILQDLEDNAGQFEYRLGEILLIVDNPRRENEVRAVAMGLFDQLQQGANFQNLASQFSQSATSASGGDLGWLAESQLSELMGAAVKDLNVGDFTQPVRTAGGFYILQLRDRRRILSVDPLDVQLNLSQIYIPFEGLSQERATLLLDRTEQTVSGISSCAGISAGAAQIGQEAQTGELGIVRLRDLTAELRKALSDLEIGQSSTPIVTQDGMRIFFVCARQEPELQKPTFEAVQRRLEGQRLAMMGRRYLRDLRRDAIVDYRVDLGEEVEQ